MHAHHTVGKWMVAVVLLVVATAVPIEAAPKGGDASPADLKKGRGSMNLATVRNVLREVKKGAKPDVAKFMELLGGYEGSLIDGWDERTPELLEAKELVAGWFAKFEKELKTCFRPDEPLLAVDGCPVRLRAAMDKYLAEAASKLAWAKDPKNARGGAKSASKSVAEDCETPLLAAIKKCVDAGKPADVMKHPACIRVTGDMAKIKAELVALSGGADAAEGAARAVGLQLKVLDETLAAREGGDDGIIPKDCREVFRGMSLLAESPDADRLLAGIPQDQMARWLSLTPRLDKDVLPDVGKFIKELRDKFGSDQKTFEDKLEAFRKDSAQNDVNMSYAAGAWKRLEKLEKTAAQLPAIKTALIGKIMDYSKQQYDKALKTSQEHPDYDTKMKEQSFLTLVPNMQVIVDVDPANAKAKELIEAIKKGAGGVKEAEEKAISAADWVGRTKTFSGPGDAEVLEKNILEFAKKDWVGSKNNPYTVLAVAITGEWYSHKKNIFGETVQWGLPVRVATRRASDKDNDVVVVWFLSILTQEGPSVQKAAPWAQFAVGDSYRMRQAKFDQQSKK